MLQHTRHALLGALLTLSAWSLVGVPAGAAAATPAPSNDVNSQLDANINAAQTALNKGDYATAIASLQKNIALDANQPMFFQDEGLVYQKWGESLGQKADASSYFDKGIDAYNRAVSLLSKQVGTNTLQALMTIWEDEAAIYFNDKRDPKGAQTLLNQALAQLDLAQRLSADGVSIQRSKAYLHYVWAVYAQNSGAASDAAGYFTSAIDGYNQAVSQASKASPRNPTLLATLWLEEANVYNVQNKMGDAEAVLKTALAKLPSNVALNYQLGIYEWQQYQGERTQRSDPSLDPELTQLLQSSIGYFTTAIKNNADHKQRIPYAYFFVGLTKADKDAAGAKADLEEFIAEMKQATSLATIDDAFVDVANTVLAGMSASSPGK